MAKCDIIVPVWNNKELTEQCLNSIFNSEDCGYHIIIIDNASDLPASSYLKQISGSYSDKVTLIRNDQNLGFTKAVNQGIKTSLADYVCIINNDIIVFDNWLSEMITIADSSADIGIVNPANNFGRPKPKDKSYQEYARDKVKGRQGTYVETVTPVGFCYLIKREIINKIGLLDERFNPGYFEDTEYARRAKTAGYKAVFAKGAFVFHFEHASFKKRGFNALFKRSEEKFFSQHKKSGRILFVLTGSSSKLYEKIVKQSRDLLDDFNWVSVYFKKSAPKFESIDHTYFRQFRFSDKLFIFVILSKILFKKKKFTKIFTDNRILATLLRGLQWYHKAELELLIQGG